MEFVVVVRITLPGGFSALPERAAQAMYYGYTPAQGPHAVQNLWKPFNQDLAVFPDKNGIPPQILKELDGAQVLGSGNCAGRKEVSHADFVWRVLLEQRNAAGVSGIHGKSVQHNRPDTDLSDHPFLGPNAS
jgi:hypothetical protein